MFSFVLHKDCKNKQYCILMAVWFWKSDTTLSQTVLTQTSWTNSLTSCLPALLCCLGFMVRYSINNTQDYFRVWDQDPIHLEWSPRSHISHIGLLLSKGLILSHFLSCFPNCAVTGPVT